MCLSAAVVADGCRELLSTNIRCPHPVASFSSSQTFQLCKRLLSKIQLEPNQDYLNRPKWVCDARRITLQAVYEPSRVFIAEYSLHVSPSGSSHITLAPSGLNIHILRSAAT